MASSSLCASEPPLSLSCVACNTQRRPADSQFYTSVRDLWANTEQIWEGVFSILASIIIMIMGIAFLKMDRSRIKWRLKLAAAFQESHAKSMAAREGSRASRFAWIRGNKNEDKEGRSGKWALFLLPFITVIREGLEAVVFVGGVSAPHMF